MTDIYSPEATIPRPHKPAPQTTAERRPLSLDMFDAERKRTAERDGITGRAGGTPRATGHFNHGSDKGVPDRVRKAQARRDKVRPYVVEGFKAKKIAELLGEHPDLVAKDMTLIRRGMR